MEYKLKFLIILLTFVKFGTLMPVVDDGKLVYPNDNRIDPDDEINSNEDLFDLPEETEHTDAEENINIEDEDLFQGDILLEPEQREWILANDSDDISKRTGLLNEEQRWPKDSRGKVIVPYVIQKSDYSMKDISET
jgi:hypothetical protein